MIETAKRLGTRRATAMVVLALLAVAPAALAATPGRYVGKTSQKLRVTLEVTSASRADIQIKYRGQCTNGRTFTAETTTENARIDDDGEFSVAMGGKATFIGIGKGRFNYTLAGDIRKNVAEGRFRSTFTSGSVTCRSGRVTFKARRR